MGALPGRGRRPDPGHEAREVCRGERRCGRNRAHRRGSTANRRGIPAGRRCRRSLSRHVDGEPMTRVVKTEAEWRAELTPEQYRVLREKGTERPFEGEYDHTFEQGTYHCAGCGTELFASDAKYDS